MNHEGVGANLCALGALRWKPVPEHYEHQANSQIETRFIRANAQLPW